jgi:hypothetical protein
LATRSPQIARYQRSRKKGQGIDRRRALKLLADSPNGHTEAILQAHGIPLPVLTELVRAGLATASAERVRAGGRMIKVVRLRITDAGRKAIGA